MTCCAAEIALVGGVDGDHVDQRILVILMT